MASICRELFIKSSAASATIRPPPPSFLRVKNPKTLYELTRNRVLRGESLAGLQVAPAHWASASNKGPETYYTLTRMERPSSTTTLNSPLNSHSKASVASASASSPATSSSSTAAARPVFYGVLTEDGHVANGGQETVVHGCFKPTFNWRFWSRKYHEEALAKKLLGGSN